MEIKCQLDATDEFYCRSYCLLNMFRAPLCPSSGTREYYTSGCCPSKSSSPQNGHTTLSSTPYRQLENQAPNTTDSSHLYNTLELLKMGIMVPETCWASNKICNKNSCAASSWHFISTYNRRCTVKTTLNICPCSAVVFYFTFVEGLVAWVNISNLLATAAVLRINTMFVIIDLPAGFHT